MAHTDHHRGSKRLRWFRRETRRYNRRPRVQVALDEFWDVETFDLPIDCEWGWETS